MFKLADNREIGLYLKKLIYEKFNAQRQFCRKYIEDEGKVANDEEIGKMTNRLSQIIKGKKSIQIYDLPHFTKLLDVSCEDILSAGKSHEPTSNHLTNYEVAFSTNKEDWKAYINRKDQIILNADEYGKTVIDYALQFENYDFLKYLMDNNYIWFIGADEKEYRFSFGAGTSIKYTPSDFKNNMNVLDASLNMKDELRIKMITLAMKHGDTEMITNLRGREIPSLYTFSFWKNSEADFHKYYNKEFLETIANSSNYILEYFSEEFKIKNQSGLINTFIFPYIGNLIEILIKKENDYVEFVLEAAINHNENAYNRLKELINSSVNYYKKNTFMKYSPIEDIKAIIKRDLDIFSSGDIICYYNPGEEWAKDRIITNIIYTKAKSSNCKLNKLIEKLNKLYNNIKNIDEIIF